MKTKFLYGVVSLLLLCCGLFLSKCAKEYSHEGGYSGAEFELLGAGGNCSGSVVAGNYYAGKSVGTDANVLVQVHVSIPGNFSLTTNNVNGMQFVTQGNFADTGVQSVTLTAKGTPSATGNFDFMVTNGAGCTFTVTVTSAPVPSATYALDGAPSGCTNFTLAGKYTQNTPLDITTYVEVTADVTVPGPYSITTDTIDGIYFAATGNFTATGKHVVMLMGNGTPQIPQNLEFTVSGAGSSCTFKVSVANPDPVAVYVLESGTGPNNTSVCIYTLGGNYNVNIPLNSTNSLTMRVYVQTVGNFTVSTQTLDGMTFTHTGTFSATGIQYIVLNGSGSPQSSGTYTFTPQIVGPAPLGGQACDFDVTVQ